MISSDNRRVKDAQKTMDKCMRTSKQASKHSLIFFVCSDNNNPLDPAAGLHLHTYPGHVTNYMYVCCKQDAIITVAVMLVPTTLTFKSSLLIDLKFLCMYVCMHAYIRASKHVCESVVYAGAVVRSFVRSFVLFDARCFKKLLFLPSLLCL